ncbi:hypothetical protein [Candidatus Uabimicrobium amorphum]|uniref:Uncharacterized protein n=1 Tax=Uabimicrobium amorphum TaxID=2596890 RepID=A0A5S9IKB8_UABAM|nr:hypothetical protein [Candidatus Uabimicrobium amorphum]BBM82640.1 hypothetical protein UABAM_00983 [Candidatus Uabimicrobium amorphum]
MFRIPILLALFCSFLYAEIQFQANVVCENNEVIFSATAYEDGRVRKDLNVVVNDEKIGYHPVLGYISGFPSLKPGDTASVVVTNTNGDVVFADDVVLPLVPSLIDPQLKMDKLYPTVYQWQATSPFMYFSYENNNGASFEKYFYNSEASIEIPTETLEAGNGYITICALSGDAEKSSLIASSVVSQKVNVDGERKQLRDKLPPAKSWKDSFEIPKVGKRTFDLNAYIMPHDGNFKVGGRNRRFKASVIVVYYNEQPIWTWDRVYKFSKKNYSQSFARKAQEMMVVATHHIHCWVDFK